MSFRGINTTVIQIRRQVFTEVARMAYANVKGDVYPQFIHHSQIFALEQLFQVFHSVVSCIRMG